MSVVRFPVGPPEAPASIPAQRGRATRFTPPSASSPAGSRTGLSKSTPLRQGEVGETRDWPHLPESTGALGSTDACALVCIGALPQAAARAHQQAWTEQGPIPSPLTTLRIYDRQLALQVPDLLRVTTLRCAPAVDTNSTAANDFRRVSPRCRHVDWDNLWSFPASSPPCIAPLRGRACARLSPGRTASIIRLGA